MRLRIKLCPWRSEETARGRDHDGNRYGDPNHAYQDIVDRRVKYGKTGH
jgi:hypothetical protein